MIDMWRYALETVQKGDPAVLVMVVAHSGSVPGTTGAAMVVTHDSVVGTVGGGIAEHELIETARNLKSRSDLIDVEHTAEESGSLCSGHHSLALTALGPDHEPVLESVVSTLSNLGVGTLQMSESGLEFEAGTSRPTSNTTTAHGWSFVTTLGLLDTLTIVGGGHCALALSRVMTTLPFRVVVLDERPGLPTMIANSFAHELRVVPYPDIVREIPQGDRSWVVVMTFGHAHDEVVLRAIEGMELRYLGLMGSQAKVRQMFDRMRSDGVSPEFLSSITAPVGISIGSHTPEEIAVSIAAEIIRMKNRE